MFISRGILLTVIVLFTFSPAILDWIIHTPSAWYRPFIAWFSLIVIAFLAQNYRQNKDHHA